MEDAVAAAGAAECCLQRRILSEPGGLAFKQGNMDLELLRAAAAANTLGRYS
jgi:hypothetical protein